MNAGSSRISTSQRFAQPLVREGRGSVFPVGLPLSKRRALEVEIIKRFDRRDFVDNRNIVGYQLKPPGGIGCGVLLGRLLRCGCTERLQHLGTLVSFRCF